MSESFAISVVIPTCDRAEFLPRAIDSVRQAAEEFNRFNARRISVEVIVVNDGRDEVDIESLPGVLCDHVFVKSVRSTTGPYGGPAAARHDGIVSASSGYIFLLDDDDLFCTNRFFNAVPALCGGRYDLVLERVVRVIDQKSQESPVITGPSGGDDDPFNLLLDGGESTHIAPAATSFLRDAYYRCGGYNKNLRLGEDGELLLRMAYQCRVKLFGGPVVAKCIRHATNTSRGKVHYAENVRALAALLRSVDKKKYPRIQHRIVRALRGKIDFTFTLIRAEVPLRRNRLPWVVRVMAAAPWRYLTIQQARSMAVCLAYPALLRETPTASAE